MADENNQQSQQDEARRLYEEALKQQQAHQRAQQAAYAEFQAEISRAQVRARISQEAIDQTPRRNYAVIAALDLRGGLSKDGQIPWNHPTDFKWFQQHTKGHICIMGRGTYEDINARLGDKATDSVLPERKCFVVSSTLKQEDVKNATVIRELFDIERHLLIADDNKTAFIIGGSAVYNEGIAMANTAYITAIDQEYGCDKFFPTRDLDQYFAVSQVFKAEEAPDLRFVIFKRK